MPIHDLGYRPWKGTRKSQLSRWSIIAQAGIQLAGKNRWLRRMLIVAWLPVLYWGIAFFFVGQTLEQPIQSKVPMNAVGEELGKSIDEKLANQSILDINRDAAAGRIESMFRRVPRVALLADSIRESENAVEARNRIWGWLLMVFFRYSQAILVLMIVGFVAPSLISQDLRSRAYLLYFSRPIGRLEYILGKVAVPGAYIGFVSTFPALVLYLFAVMMSPSMSVVWSTWDVPIRILLSTVVLVLPTASLALMLSSLTEESRFASFSWFATWILGHGAWMAILFSEGIRQNLPPSSPEVLESWSVKTWSLLSLYNNMGDVQTWIFGFKSFSEIWPAFAVLASITVVAFLVLYRRVNAPLRA
jgi:hypothetical protein